MNKRINSIEVLSAATFTFAVNAQALSQITENQIKKVSQPQE